MSAGEPSGFMNRVEYSNIMRNHFQDFLIKTMTFIIPPPETPLPPALTLASSDEASYYIERLMLKQTMHNLCPIVSEALTSEACMELNPGTPA